MSDNNQFEIQWEPMKLAIQNCDEDFGRADDEVLSAQAEAIAEQLADKFGLDLQYLEALDLATDEMGRMRAIRAELDLRQLEIEEAFNRCTPDFWEAYAMELLGFVWSPWDNEVKPPSTKAERDAAVIAWKSVEKDDSPFMAGILARLIAHYVYNNI